MTGSEDGVVTRGQDGGVSSGGSLGQRLTEGDGDQGGQGQQRPHGGAATEYQVRLVGGQSLVDIKGSDCIVY